ncbi:MAG: sulfur-carrier protein [Clostridia bacterium]|jgi:molybdopterin synthase sulfur carrier subunit|nr:MoaD/ThiS family protein [Clostridiales bacterium]MDK2984898.1 sulfur-carrier protein [Clostridia bacterium]
MKVKFFAFIRKYAGNTKERDDVEAHTLYELLDKLGREYGSTFKAKVFPDNKVSEDVIILINGVHIVHLDGTNTQLKEDDVVSIFPKVFGG